MVFTLARLREECDARHTFAPTLMAADVPPPAVAEYSGHFVGEYLAQLLTGAPRLRAALAS